MKRFITYLYEYENGKKTKNTGFIRVDEKNGNVFLQISVRNVIRSLENGEIYAFVWESGLQGVLLGEISVSNNQTDSRLELEVDNLEGTGYSFERVVGIGVVFQKNTYMASCWNDSYAEAVGNGRFQTWEKKSMIPDKKEVLGTDPYIEVQTEEIKQEESLKAASYELVTYQKMELNAIKDLPSPNWYLCNNRFLVHGFFNYGYLILKKASEADGTKSYLGVPGIYEKPEMVMAALFGFPEFQTLPEEVSSAKMEEIVSGAGEDKKSQEPKTGTFGCWLIPVQLS